MGLVYFISTLFIGLASFCKKNQSKYLTYIILSLLIFLLSLRSAPDEYLAYIEEFGNWSSVVNGFPLAEPFFSLICLICSKTSNPLFWLYLSTYIATFLLIIQGLRVSQLSFKSIPICISFYLAHWFLTLGYVAIRGSLANALCFYGSCLLFSKKNFLIRNLFFILGILTHVQTTILVFSIYLVFIMQIEKTLFSKLYKLAIKRIYFILPLTALLFILLSEIIANLNTSILTELFLNNTRYNLYVEDLEETAFFVVSIFELSGIFNIGLQGMLVYLYLKRIKIFNNFLYAMLTLSIFGTFILLIFYNFSFLAFRFASGFLLFNLPIIGYTLEKKEKGIIKNSSFSFIYIAIIVIFLTYNVFLQNKFGNFAI